jgi:hypothetical protein
MGLGISRDVKEQLTFPPSNEVSQFSVEVRSLISLTKKPILVLKDIVLVDLSA